MSTEPESQIRISYSKLSTYLNCAKGYKYQYEDELPQAPSDNYHAYIGSVVQYIFEQVTNHRIYQKTDLNNFISKFKAGLMDAVKTTTYDMFDKKPDVEKVSKFYKELQIMRIDYMNHTMYEVQEMILSHLLSNLELYWKHEVMGKLDDIVCEQEISFYDKTHSGVPFNMIGFADFLHTGKDGLISILDGKKNYKPENHKPEQIGLYLWGLRDKPINLEGKFWSYKTSKFHPIKIDLNKTRDWMYNTVDFIIDSRESGIWNYATNKKACHFCAYKTICEQYPKFK